MAGGGEGLPEGTEIESNTCGLLEQSGNDFLQRGTQEKGNPLLLECAQNQSILQTGLLQSRKHFRRDQEIQVCNQDVSEGD